MHEMSIVSGLVDILEQQVAQHGVDRVLSVTLKIGRLRAVEPQQLRACFELLAEDTAAAGARLVIEEVPVRGRCRACGREFAVPHYRFECPACHGGDIAIISGQELYLDRFEAAGPAPAAAATPATAATGGAGRTGRSLPG